MCMVIGSAFLTLIKGYTDNSISPVISGCICVYRSVGGMPVGL
jgi:large-conductance mechanosensitive channel